VDPSPRSTHDAERMHHRPWTRREALDILERPGRADSEDAEALWDRAGIEAGDRIAEVGAGSGYFAVPAARRVGPTGRVFAIDLSEELVRLVSERATAEGLPWLEAVRSSVDRIPLPDGAVDLLLLANVLHDLPDATVGEAVRLVRPGGRVVNVDWDPRATAIGPPLAIRLTPAQATDRLAGFGLVAGAPWRFGPEHYGITLARP